jgi:hypothetical protein
MVMVSDQWWCRMEQPTLERRASAMRAASSARCLAVSGAGSSSSSSGAVTGPWMDVSKTARTALRAASPSPVSRAGSAASLTCMAILFLNQVGGGMPRTRATVCPVMSQPRVFQIGDTKLRLDGVVALFPRASFHPGCAAAHVASLPGLLHPVGYDLLAGDPQRLPDRVCGLDERAPASRAPKSTT